jgi:hypothetical protein
MHRVIPGLGGVKRAADSLDPWDEHYSREAQTPINYGNSGWPELPILDSPRDWAPQIACLINCSKHYGFPYTKCCEFIRSCGLKPSRDRETRERSAPKFGVSGLSTKVVIKVRLLQVQRSAAGADATTGPRCRALCIRIPSPPRVRKTKCRHVYVGTR